jgi:hypothetical protein
MMNRYHLSKSGSPSRLVASFGRARLVCLGARTYELVSGSAEEMTAAKEWISIFDHTALLGGSDAHNRATNNSR